MATDATSTTTMDAAMDASPLLRALVEDGTLDRSRVDRALRIASLLEEPKSTVQVLVELGELSEQDLSDAVERYGATFRIGDVLMEQGHITHEQLDAALERHAATGEHVGAALVAAGEISERMLLRTVARQRGVPFVEPSFPMADTNCLDAASPDFMKRYRFVPFSEDEAGVVTVVVNDLDDEKMLSVLQDLFQDNARLALGPSDAIDETLSDYDRYRERAQVSGGATLSDEGSLIEQVNHLLHQAIDERASDIHIEPMANDTRLRFRIDGVLVFKTELPKELHNRLVSRIKVMAEMDIADHLRHQGGRILLEYKGLEYDLRVSVYITVHGENVVIRILNKELGLVSLEKLGMSPGLRSWFQREVLDAPSGVVLITAPTGEGKTTTLYSCLDYANDESIKIITAEDPVEYMLEGVIQCAIQEKSGRSFETTLREIVRQDPDIVVLGEIRDVPTAEFAIEAALTGHKVYCTFHTEDSVAAMLRLLDMGIEPFLIASTVRAVLAQRLLRRLCDGCTEEYRPTVEDFDKLGVDPGEARMYTFRRGRGCPHCNFTGYRGRVAVFESLILNQKLRAAVYARQPADRLHDIAFETTNITGLREDALVKAIQGVTSLDEIRRKTPVPEIMRSISTILRLSGQGN